MSGRSPFRPTSRRRIVCCLPLPAGARRIDRRNAAHSPRPHANSLGACRRGHRGCHAHAAVRREPPAGHLDELRGSLQLRPDHAVLSAPGRDLGAPVAAAVRGRPRARGIPVGGSCRRLVACLGARHVRSNHRVRTRRQARVDVYGGLFIGFGTRLAGGCTSGHGVFGMSNFEYPSFLATASFMAAGIVTTQLVYRVIFVMAR